MIEPFILLDTHSTALSSDTLAFLEKYRSVFDKPGATMTYERDDRIEYDDIVADLKLLRNLFGEPQERRHDLVISA
jgi:uncharacterized protein (UPF0276 family)